MEVESLGSQAMKSKNKCISIHHIGGRAGSRAFPVLNSFEKDIINVLYDVDSDCLDQIKEMNQGLESELHVLPYCLGNACESASININYDPYTSSLYDMDPECNSHYFFYGDHDYLLSEACKTVERRPVQMVTMDHIFQSKDTAIAPPDFLSIDAQGSEYEILLGAKETIQSGVVAIVLEAYFHPLYKGQKLFGDLTRLLADQGFSFVRFMSIGEMSPQRAPIGLRGEGFQVSCDALFFRQIGQIKSREDELKRYLMLRKLAFMAIVFNQFEYGLECLRQSKGYHNRHWSQPEGFVYLRFLEDLQQHIEKMPVVYPPTFMAKYPSFAASKSRFAGSAADKSGVVSRFGLADRVKQLLRHIPVLYPLLRYIKRILNRPFGRIISSIKPIFSGYTDVEAFLIKYGLKSQANLLRKNRLIQAQCLKKSW